MRLLRNLSNRTPLLFAFMLATSVVPALALTHWEPQRLYEASDLVVTGEVVGFDQDMDSTRTQIRVNQIVKGSTAQGALLLIHSRGGKVMVEPEEPFFAQSQKNLLFLTLDQDSGYRCTNGADGQKVILNDNVYPYHDNALTSQKLKDYLEAFKTMGESKSEAHK